MRALGLREQETETEKEYTACIDSYMYNRFNVGISMHTKDDLSHFSQ